MCFIMESVLCGSRQKSRCVCSGGFVFRCAFVTLSGFYESFLGHLTNAGLMTKP